jgi:hypothetical protein
MIDVSSLLKARCMFGSVTFWLPVVYSFRSCAPYRDLFHGRLARVVSSLCHMVSRSGTLSRRSFIN